MAATLSTCPKQTYITTQMPQLRKIIRELADDYRASSIYQPTGSSGASHMAHSQLNVDSCTTLWLPKDVSKDL
jgi:hypothetical protein